MATAPPVLSAEKAAGASTPAHTAARRAHTSTSRARRTARRSSADV
ncbi:hypothetical protein [Streptomyces venezuelae]